MRELSESWLSERADHSDFSCLAFDRKNGQFGQPNFMNLGEIVDSFLAHTQLPCQINVVLRALACGSPSTRFSVTAEFPTAGTTSVRPTGR
jgi:hypothetical protein